ncbi:MAG TPA: hypothetical protein VFA77_07815 [Candidatus Eisenbacteria bacterium]|nr:hypothetical protein [Candidatus Eisenbacteria bacterium]
MLGKTSVDELAGMVKGVFERVEHRFDIIETRLGSIDTRLREISTLRIAAS